MLTARVLRRALAVALALALVGLGCATSSTGDDLALPSSVDPAPLPQPLVRGTDSSDGAHRVPATGVLDGARVLDVALASRPAWIVGAGTSGATWWVVVDESGAVRGLRVPDDDPAAFEDVPVVPDRLPPGAPPVVETVDPITLVAPPADGAPLAPPLRLLPSGTAAVLDDGAVRLGDGPDAPVLAVDAPPDARMAVDPVTGALAVPAGASDRYPHGALGDDVEATGVVVVDVDGAVRRIDVADDEVLEGLGPAWVDVEGDSTPELAAVVSSFGAGSRLVVFGLDGRRREGPPTGRSNRWIHLVGGTFAGSAGEIELVAVRTPHLTGTVEWYRAAADGLEVVAALDGYRSHVLGTRNLDLALLTDGTGDRTADVVIPTADLGALAVLTRVDEAPGAVEAVRLPLPGTLATNVAAAGRTNQPLVLAAATDTTLRLWLAGPGERDRAGGTAVPLPPAPAGATG